MTEFTKNHINAIIGILLWFVFLFVMYRIMF